VELVEMVLMYYENGSINYWCSAMMDAEMCHIVKNVDFVKNDGCADVRAVRFVFCLIIRPENWFK
jgi:hypothetical protein